MFYGYLYIFIYSPLYSDNILALCLTVQTLGKLQNTFVEQECWCLDNSSGSSLTCSGPGTGAHMVKCLMCLLKSAWHTQEAAKLLPTLPQLIPDWQGPWASHGTMNTCTHHPFVPVYRNLLRRPQASDAHRWDNVYGGSNTTCHKIHAMVFHHWC